MSDELTVRNSILEIQHLWPSIARDIALTVLPQEGTCVVSISSIQREYGLTDEEMLQLFVTPRFEHLMWNEMTRLRKEGPTLGHVYWAEGMAVRMGEDIYNDLYGNVEARAQDKIKFFELLSQQARFMPTKTTAEAGPTTANNATAQVAVNIAVPEGITNPRFAHLKQETIDVTTNVLE